MRKQDSISPALRDSANPSDSPALRGEHATLWTWVHGSIERMGRRMDDQLDRVHERIAELSSRLDRHDGAEEARGEWRDKFDAKLDDIASRVGPPQPTGWRALVTPQNITTLALFILVWAVLFGPSDVGDRIDQIRGAPAAQPR